MFADDLESQLQRGQVLAQPVVKFARDPAALRLLGRRQAAQDLVVGRLGPLALGDLGLQGPVGFRQLGGAVPDADLELVAFALRWASAS